MIRIIRIKFLYRAALNELDSGHPFAAGMAVSLLQDAVEAMAHEAAASVGARVGARTYFLEHWDAVAKTGSPKQLLHKMEMNELNTARVGFKHHGVNPAQSDAEKHRLAVQRFLAETARDFFNVDFDELSEVDLVVDAKVRDALKAAESTLAANDPTKSLECCRAALDVVEEIIKESVPVTERAPAAPSVPKEFQSAADGFLNWANRRFVALENSVAMSVLGVNPAEYWFLYGSLPRRTGGGGFYWQPVTSPISTQTAERAQVCIRIIIDLALRVDRVRADLERLARQAGIPEEQRQLREWQERLLSTPIPSDGDGGSGAPV